MPSDDTAFTGSIPALYDRCLVPLLFEPYAEEVARRAAALRPERILETAAGTGILSAALRSALPDAEIVVTDLNQAMLDVAARRFAPERTQVRQADAQQLPFDDGTFDLVVCQFGIMFMPDKVAANREARRVLRDGGHYVVVIWDSIDRNAGSQAMSAALAELFPDDPPRFLDRTPFGYADPERIEHDLREAGFTDIGIDVVEKRSRLASARDAAMGMCGGSPLRAEIEERDPAKLDAAVDAAALALGPWEGPGGLDAPMSALIVTAVR